MFDIIMSIGNSEIEAMITESKAINRAESIEDIALIEEILTYETYDYIIVNSLLSASKVTKLAGFIKENLDQSKKPKMIVLLADLSDKKLMAQLVGLDVNAFVPLDQLQLIERYLKEYPQSFDLSALGNSNDSEEPARMQYRTVNGTIVIGVFSIAHGAGASTTALKLAEEIANCGYRVVCAQMDQECFAYHQKKARNVTYLSVTDEITEKALHLAYGSIDYQFIVIDFGKMYEVDLKGEIIDLNQNRLADFTRCSYKIGCCFAAPWHTNKLKVFTESEHFEEELLNNQLFLLISGDKANEAIADYHELEIWHRDDFEDFKDKLLQRMGILQKAKKKQLSWFKRRQR